ncbi:hypothetical protein [Pseudomonas syringae]|uniref:hypothetical protein n=1 Tax=Pseudomonas syringae TaxID=317 RepID=UPI000A1DDB65|nr:hypothetical protein [Pseudomonas syringae]OSN39549.1 hypothetical protein BV342_01260 [Pseudomonas syringae pv. actinidiae]OSR62604.1 hypothetical protein BV325_01642 [Pseudomonas syringae pv. actinidiae]OSR79931.1 hypothetical protein BV328_01628 [Pseudomonas syringae pv. actinidiae]
MTIGELVLNASEVHGHDVEDQRAYAVAAALEVIAVKAGQSGAHMTHLEKEMGRLSVYADQIQEALKTK